VNDKDLITNDEMVYDHFKYLYKRVNKAKPDKEDVLALKEFMTRYPAIIEDINHLPNLVMEEFLELLYPKKSTQEVVRAQLEQYKKEYGYESMPPDQRMLVDNILVCWLRWNYAEGCLNHQYPQGTPYQDAEFWEMRSSAAQLRLTRAIATLSRIRKFHINFQVNIAEEGSQQINIMDNKH
jgi:hypothetical protein